MTTRSSDGTPSAILCADWGKESSKRAVYAADVSARVVRRVPGYGWSVAGVLAEAQRWTLTGSVLATFDAPLGVPDSYLTALGRLPSAEPLTTFLDLLTRAGSMPRFYEATTLARDWTVEQPFFAVPKGKGGLGSYRAAAARFDVDTYRQIDRMTGAKSVFIKSGVPGSVGSAACALWQELASELTAHRRTFKVWPFEGEIQALLQSTSVVIGEIYPRAAYATALLDVPPTTRPPLVVAKTIPDVRRKAIAEMQNANWVRSLEVKFEDLAHAEANEDDFDACMTAAALLRCVLEGAPICPAQLQSPTSEGGMLGTGSVNFELPARTLSWQGRERPHALPTARTVRPTESGRSAVSVVRVDVGADVSVFRCPIAGCSKVFHGSRGGWDGHVGSPRLHPNWHPELGEADARKRLFEAEFPMFFR